MAEVIDLQKSDAGGVERKSTDVDLSGLTKKVAEMFTPFEVPFILLQQSVGRLNPSPMGGGLVPDASEVKQ